MATFISIVYMENIVLIQQSEVCTVLKQIYIYNNDQKRLVL